jgi:hypothetical protein
MDEGGCNLNLLSASRLVLAVNPLNQKVYSRAGDLRNRLRYYRQSWLEHLTKLELIVGDQSDVLGHTHSVPPQRTKHTYRHVVIA